MRVNRSGPQNKSVLILTSDIYNKIGGGEKVYRTLINDNPEVHFYFFTSNSNEKAPMPSNAHPIPIRQKPVLDLKHRRNRYHATEIIKTKKDLNTIERNAAELAEQYAMSVNGMAFDVVDIPEYEIVGKYIRNALERNKVKFQILALFIHGSLSSTLRFEGVLSPLEIAQIEEIEQSQREIADVFITLNSWYPQKLGIENHRCIEISPWQFISPYNGLDKDTPFSTEANFVYFGRWEKRKGINLVFPLMKLITTRKFNFIIAGDSAKKKALVRWVKNSASYRDLECQVLPITSSDKLYNSLSENDILIIPSRFDSFNLVALEALALGKNVAISSQTGVFHFLRQQHPEITFIEFDPNNLVKSAIDLSNHLIGERNIPELVNRNIQESNIAISNLLRSQYGESLFELLDSKSEQIFETDDGLVFEKFSPKRRLLIGIRNFVLHLSKTKFGSFKRYATNILSRSDKFLNLIRFLLIYIQSTSAVRFLLARRRFEETRNVYFRPRQFLDYSSKKEGLSLRQVTYGIRSLRFAGYWNKRVNSQNLEKDLFTLGMVEESQALSVILSDPSGEKTFRYLEDRRMKLREFPKFNFKSMPILESEIASNCPRTSIIVSSYNGSPKLPEFLKRLSLCPELRDGTAEILIIDAHSNSPDTEIAIKVANALGIALRAIRVLRRITIQEAWNFGITQARGEYLCFLGVDETIYPDALTQLSQRLDADQAIDWVMGNSVVTNVGSDGEFIDDVMVYRRDGADKASPFLETCYVSYVAGMYRKTIHEKFGYYDPLFKGAGDTEFKSRVLPSINVGYLDKTLGEFLNYPETRTTATEKVELEDIRAWYIFRTPGGLKYQASLAGDGFLEKIGWNSLGYRKSYLEHTSTDIEIASAVFRIAKNGNYGLSNSLLMELKRADQQLQNMRKFLGFGSEKWEPLRFRNFYLLAKWFDNDGRKSAIKGARRIRLDNMFEQHIWYW